MGTNTDMKKKYFLKVVAVFFVLFINYTLAASTDVPKSGPKDELPDPDEVVVYKETEQGKLQMHIFYPKAYEKDGQLPAIVFFFGGGWNSGEITQFYHQAAYLASRGMVAFVANYRVRGRHQTTPIESLKDAKSALRWVKENSGKFGVDPQKVVASGGSAGGHIAATTSNDDELNEKTDNLDISSRPCAMVLFNPVLDNGPDGFRNERFGDDWESASPIHNIDSENPPTIIFFGTHDRVVPYESAIAYKEKMEAAGGRCEVKLFEGEKHGFFNYRETENYYETMYETDMFLISLGLLEGSPILEKP